MNRIDLKTSSGDPFDEDGIGVNVARSFDDLELTVRRPPADLEVEGDVALMLSTPDGHTRLSVHVDEKLATKIAFELSRNLEIPDEPEA